MSTSQPQEKKRALLIPGMVLCVVCALLAGCDDVYTAAREGDAVTVEKGLRRGMDPNKKSWRNATLLHEAAAGGHLEVVKVLVDHGADVNRTGDTYQKPLHFAAQEGHLEIVEYLLAQGADTGKVLHETAYRGQVGTARMLVEHGVDIDEKGIDEATPLEAAVSHRQVELVAFLLKNGANVNSQGIYGRTALHVAALNDDLPMARLLLENGADPALECNGRPVEGRSEAFRSLLADWKPLPTR